MQIRTQIVFFLASIMLTAVSGCVLTTDHVDLTYAQQPGISKTPDAGNIVVSVKINDQRREAPPSNIVGRKKNAFGSEFAPILANEDVTVTIRRAMEQELQSRGFSIGNEAPASVVADLIRFWGDIKMGFFTVDAMADMEMHVSVKNRNGKTLYHRLIQMQGVDPNHVLGSSDNIRLALNNALEKSMKLLFEDQLFIAALIDVSRESPS